MNSCVTTAASPNLLIRKMSMVPPNSPAFNGQAEYPNAAAHYSRVMQRPIFQLADLDRKEGEEEGTNREERMKCIGDDEKSFSATKMHKKQSKPDYEFVILCSFVALIDL
jgi:hypothetical protein